MADTFTFIALVRELIKEGDLKGAVGKVAAFLEGSPYANEAILQSARYNDIMRQIRLGVVSFENATMTQNQITAGLLALLDFIEEKQNDPNIKTELERFEVQFNKNTVNNSTINAGGDVTIEDKKTIIQNADKIYNIDKIDNANFS